MQKGGEYKKCLTCNAEFYEFPYLKGKRKFCSKKCANVFNAEHLSKIRKGKNNPMYGIIPWNKGIPRTEEQNMHHSKKMKEYYEKNGNIIGFQKENRTKSQYKIGHEGMKGNNNPAWEGGVAKLPYGDDWTPELKEQIKKRDNHICQKCGIKIIESRRIKNNPTKEWLTVHHIDYDKQNCSEKNLITLCHKCNCSVNKDREKWLKYFNKLISSIYEK